MSYRLSFYKIAKKKLDEVVDWTDENFECDDDLRNGHDELCDNAEQVLFDCTNWLYFDEFEEICRNGQEGKIWSRMFNNELDIESDITFMKMNKEQFKGFIDLVRHHITDMYDRQYIKLWKNEELDDLYGGKIKGDELEKKYSSAFSIKDKKNFNVLDKLIENAKEVNRIRDIWNIFYRNDEDFWEYAEGNGKNKVSFTDDWESCLCNLMYLYRTVDWVDEMIMVIGG